MGSQRFLLFRFKISDSYEVAATTNRLAEQIAAVNGKALLVLQRWVTFATVIVFSCFYKEEQHMH